MTLEERQQAALNRIASSTAVGRVRNSETAHLTYHGNGQAVAGLEQAVLRLEKIADDLERVLAA